MITNDQPYSIDFGPDKGKVAFQVANRSGEVKLANEPGMGIPQTPNFEHIEGELSHFFAI